MTREAYPFPAEFLDPSDIASWQYDIDRDIRGRGGIEALSRYSKAFYAMESRDTRARAIAWITGWRPYPERSWKWEYWHHCLAEIRHVLAEAESRPDYVPLEDA